MAWTTPYTSTVGMVLTAALKNQDRDNFTYLKGAITTYTPQIDQGVSTNIGKTVNEARYTLAGDMYDVWLNLVLTGAGTAGSNVTVTLPASASGSSSSAHIGVMLVYDASTTTRYQGAAEIVGPTVVGCSYPGVNAGLVGASPSFAVANSDVIRAHFRFPA